MSDNLFQADICRVDRGKREIWGWATTEQLASDGKVISFEAACAAFEDWIQRGNVREMHERKPVAKAFAYQPDETNRRILVGTRVSRSRDGEDALIKAEERILTGFSVRGTATQQEMRIIRSGSVNRSVPWVTGLKILELSYVDAPSDDGANFTDVIRLADDGELALPDELPEAGDVVIVRAAGEHGSMKGSHSHAHPAFGSQDGDETHEHEHSHDGDADHRHEHAGVQRITDAGDPEAEIERRDFSEAQREESADKGHALPDGSFPIENKADLGNAIQAYGRAKDKAAAKAHIEKRARALGAEHMIPDSWDGGANEGESMKRSADGQPATSDATEAGAEPSAEALPTIIAPDASDLPAITAPATREEILRENGMAAEAIVTTPPPSDASTAPASTVVAHPPAAQPELVARADGEPAAEPEAALSAEVMDEIHDMQGAAAIREQIKALLARETGELVDPANKQNESWQVKCLAEALTHIECFIAGEASEVAQLLRSKEASVLKAEELESTVADVVTRLAAVEAERDELKRSDSVGAVKAELAAATERIERLEAQPMPGGAISRTSGLGKLFPGDDGEPVTPEALERGLDAIAEEADKAGLGSQVDMLRARVAMRQVYQAGPNNFFRNRERAA